MALHYRGPHARVFIPLPNGHEADVAKGKYINLRDDEYRLTAAQADEIEAGLLADEDSWREPTPPAKPAPSTTDKEG